MRITPWGFLGEVLKRYRSQVTLLTIAISMIIVGSFDTPDINILEGGFQSESQMKNFLGGMILIIFGVVGMILSVLPKGSLAAGLMTLGIVIHFFFFISYLFADTSADDDFSYIIRLAFYLLLAFCALFAFKMILGSTQNTIRVVAVEAAFLGVAVIAFLLDIHHGLKVSEAIANLEDYHGTLLLMLISVICLNMSNSKYVSPMTRLRMNVEALETSTVTFNDTYIMRDQLLALMDPERSQWLDSDEPGVEKELDIVLYNRLRRELLVVRKWEGDDVLIASFMPGDLKVHLYKHLNFPIRHIYCYGGKDACARFRMYGDDGFFVDVLVRDVHIKKYKNSINIVDMLLRTGRDGMVISTNGVWVPRQIVKEHLILAAREKMERYKVTRAQRRGEIHGDIAEKREEIHEDIAEVREEIRGDIAETEERISERRAERKTKRGSGKKDGEE